MTVTTAADGADWRASQWRLCMPTDTHVEEAELMAQIAAGDVGTPVATLYHRYAGKLYRYGLQAMGGNSGLAEELVQEAFVRLWRYSGRYDADRGSVATYLMTIARTSAVDILRRPSSQPLEPEDSAPDPAQHDRADQILETLVMRDALADLTDEHREVLKLVYEDGLTQAQAAGRLRIPVGTVKSRLYFALVNLHEALERRGYQDASI